MLNIKIIVFPMCDHQKAPVGKSHGIASRSLLMGEHETGNVTVKIRGPSTVSRHACYIVRLKKQKDSTGYN